jgi:hypothetical protein
LNLKLIAVQGKASCAAIVLAARGVAARLRIPRSK